MRVEWVIGSLAALGMVAALLVTRWGSGLSADSVVYLESASNLLHGNGWAFGMTDGVLRPMTQYPPLFPSALALIGLTGMAVPDAARWFNAVLFAGTIFLAGMAVSRYTRGAFWPATLASFFVVTCVPLIRAYSSALTEASLIFFGLTGMFLLSVYIKKQARIWLVVAALAIALACLSRYVGVALMAGGAIALLLPGHKPLRARLFDVAVWGTVCGGPLAVWVGRNLTISGHVSRYATQVDVVGTDRISRYVDMAIQDVFAWSLPDRVPLEFRLAAFAVLVLFLVGASAALLRRRRQNPDENLLPGELRALPLVLIICGVAYCAFIVGTIVLVQQGTLSARFMALIYVIAFILLACWFYRLTNLLRSARTLRPVLLVVVCGLACLQAGYGTLWVARRYSEGLGYASSTWRESAVVRTLADLPAGTLILTNEAIPVYYLTGQPAIQLGISIDPATLSDEIRSARLETLKERIGQESAVLACFGSTACSAWADALGEVLPLRVLQREGENAVYTAAS